MEKQPSSLDLSSTNSTTTFSRIVKSILSESKFFSTKVFAWLTFSTRRGKRNTSAYGTLGFGWETPSSFVIRSPLQNPLKNFLRLFTTAKEVLDRTDLSLLSVVCACKCDLYPSQSYWREREWNPKARVILLACKRLPKKSKKEEKRERGGEGAKDFSRLPNEVIRLIATYLPSKLTDRDFVHMENTIQRAKEMWNLPKDQFFETSAKVPFEISNAFKKCVQLFTLSEQQRFRQDLSLSSSSSSSWKKTSQKRSPFCLFQ